MSDAPDWPSFQIGARDTIFALGVASTVYCELESVLYFLFGVVFELGGSEATMISAKINSEAVSILIRQQLNNGEWGDPAKDLALHFLKAHDICAENRNHLMHSMIGFGSSILFKTTKKGEVVAAILDDKELRQVADDMHEYCFFGRHVAHAISNNRTTPPVFPAEVFPWPDKPALPRSLNYKRGPQVL